MAPLSAGQKSQPLGLPCTSHPERAFAHLLSCSFPHFAFTTSFLHMRNYPQVPKSALCCLYFTLACVSIKWNVLALTYPVNSCLLFTFSSNTTASQKPSLPFQDRMYSSFSLSTNTLSFRVLVDAEWTHVQPGKQASYPLCCPTSSNSQAGGGIWLSWIGTWELI